MAPAHDTERHMIIVTLLRFLLLIFLGPPLFFLAVDYWVHFWSL